jgi:hypothetical protein
MHCFLYQGNLVRFIGLLWRWKVQLGGNKLQKNEFWIRGVLSDAACCTPTCFLFINTVVTANSRYYSYDDWLRAGRSGDRIPVGVWFSAPVQTGPGTHPASYTFGPTQPPIHLDPPSLLYIWTHPVSYTFGPTQPPIHLDPPRLLYIWTHPASYTLGTGPFPGLKRLRRGVDQLPHLAPRSRKGQSYTSTPLLGFRGLF